MGARRTEATCSSGVIAFAASAALGATNSRRARTVTSGRATLTLILWVRPSRSEGSASALSR